MEQPASCGVHGPGEIRMRSGRIASISSGDTASLRRITISAPNSPMYCTRL